MKNSSAILIALALFLVSACKKEDKGRDYAAINAIEQPVVLAYIDSSKALALFDAVATERQILLNKLEQLYPGLKTQMDNDAKQITETDDSATRALLLEDFDMSYHAQVKEAWDSSGISIASITSKYAQILGDIPFSVGEFGQIITEQVATAAEYRSPFPDDSIRTLIGTPLINSDNNCGGIIISSNIHDESTNQVRMFATFAGGCWTRNTGGVSINVPSTSQYKHLYARFEAIDSWMECNSWSLVAGSVSSAKLTTYIQKYPVGTPVTRDVVAVSAVAPIIWYARSKFEISSAFPIEIAMPTESPYYAGEYRAYMRTENSVSTFGAVCGTHSECSFSKNRTTIRMIK